MNHLMGTQYQILAECKKYLRSKYCHSYTTLSPESQDFVTFILSWPSATTNYEGLRSRIVFCHLSLNEH